MDYPNETIQLLLERRSLRAYDGRPIEPGHKRIISEATRRAATAGNMMLYSVLDITDQGIKDRLADLCDDQPMIAKAPMVWLFLADYQKWEDYFQSSGAVQKGEAEGIAHRDLGQGDIMLSVCDALIAAQSAVTAADSLHIGSCYIGDILENYEQVQELLDLPDFVLPITMICFGYPKGEWKTGIAPTPRHSHEEIFYENTYKRKDAQELQEMFAPHNEYYRQTGRLDEGTPDLAHYYYFRKHTSDFMQEMNRSVARMLKNWE